MRSYLTLWTIIIVFTFLFTYNHALATIRVSPGLNSDSINAIIKKVKPGERIVFEKGSNYVADKQILFVGLDGNTIDFNGCTFTVKANHKFVPKSVAGHYVGDVIILFANCNKIKIKGLNVDGNRTLCNNENELTAIEFSNTSGSAKDLYLKNCSCHHIIIGECSNLRFKRVLFENLGCSGGNSDVYVYRKDNIYTFWKDIRSIRPIVAGEINTGQVFYFSGGENRVKNLYCENCHATIDQRSGILNAKRITARNCCGFFVISSGSQPQSTEPVVNVRDVVLYDVCPSKNTSSVIFISSTQNCILKNFDIYMSKEQPPFSANIQIRQFKNGLFVNNVRLENINFNYQDNLFPHYGIVFNNLDRSFCALNNIQMSCTEAKVFANDCKENTSTSFINVQVSESKKVFAGNATGFLNNMIKESFIENERL